MQLKQVIDNAEQQLKTGRKYAALSDALIVASMTPDMARTQIDVAAFQVE